MTRAPGGDGSTEPRAGSLGRRALSLRPRGQQVGTHGAGPGETARPGTAGFLLFHG